MKTKHQQVVTTQIDLCSSEGGQGEHQLRRSFNFDIPYRTGILVEIESLFPLFFIKTGCILWIVWLCGSDLYRVPKVLHEDWYGTIHLINVNMLMKVNKRYTRTYEHQNIKPGDYQVRYIRNGRTKHSITVTSRSPNKVGYRLNTKLFTVRIRKKEINVLKGILVTWSLLVLLLQSSVTSLPSFPSVYHDSLGQF